MYYEIEEEINKSDLMTKFNKIVTYIFFIMIIVCALLYLIGIFFIVLKIEISAVYNISIAILFLMFIASLLVSTKVFYNVHKETINLLNEKRNMTIVMVSHDIAEAISMSDKIVVLTKRPAKVKKIYDIKLSDKSTPINNRKCKEFSKYYDTIWRDLDVHI